jgi:hypothetical protein
LIARLIFVGYHLNVAYQSKNQLCAFDEGIFPEYSALKLMAGQFPSKAEFSQHFINCFGRNLVEKGAWLSRSFFLFDTPTSIASE